MLSLRLTLCAAILCSVAGRAQAQSSAGLPVPSFDEHVWVEVPRTTSSARIYIRESDPSDSPHEQLLLEPISSAEDASALVRAKLGMEPTTWHWQGGVSSCGEWVDVDGTASLCLAVASPASGWLRLTYTLQASAGTPFYRASRLRVWRGIFRTSPFTSLASGHPLPPRDPLFLVCRTTKGLFQMNPSSGVLTPLEPSRLYPGHYDYVFYSVAEVDGERVNVLRRTLHVRSDLSLP